MQIVQATPVGDHRIRLQFEDGVEGEVDIASFVEFTGVFAPLKDVTEFAKVRVDPEAGTIVWPTGADLCPDVLYSKVTKKPIAWATTEGDGS